MKNYRTALTVEQIGNIPAGTYVALELVHVNENGSEIYNIRN
jgi:hypothetical protein